MQTIQLTSTTVNTAISSQTHASKCTRDRSQQLPAPSQFPSALQVRQSALPPIRTVPHPSTHPGRLQKQRREGSASPPVSTPAKIAIVRISMRVRVRRKVSFPLPRVQGVQDPVRRPPVTRVPGAAAGIWNTAVCPAAFRGLAGPAQVA
jgi:hypothetical protein